MRFRANKQVYGQVGEVDFNAKLQDANMWEC